MRQRFCPTVPDWGVDVVVSLITFLDIGCAVRLSDARCCGDPALLRLCCRTHPGVRYPCPGQTKCMTRQRNVDECSSFRAWVLCGRAQRGWLLCRSPYASARCPQQGAQELRQPFKSWLMHRRHFTEGLPMTMHGAWLLCSARGLSGSVESI